MDLNGMTPQELGVILDEAGTTWTYDKDGDLVVKLQSRNNGLYGVFNFVLQSDYSIQGSFLDVEGVTVDGERIWPAPTGDVRGSNVLAYKVVKIYLMPRPGGLKFQVHANVELTDRPMNISVVPSAQQREVFEKFGNNISLKEDSGTAWLVGGFSSLNIGIPELISELMHLGVEMFNGTFTGTMAVNDGVVVPTGAS